MFLSAQINAAGFIRRKAEKFFIFFALSAERVCRAERAQIFLKRRRHIAVPAPPFRIKKASRSVLPFFGWKIIA